VCRGLKLRSTSSQCQRKEVTVRFRVSTRCTEASVNWPNLASKCSMDLILDLVGSEGSLALLQQRGCMHTLAAEWLSMVSICTCNRHAMSLCPPLGKKFAPELFAKELRLILARGQTTASHIHKTTHFCKLR
jgi:hypothetical protein